MAGGNSPTFPHRGSATCETGQVDYTDLVGALRREGEALGAVKIADIDVPTCPDWTLPELIYHVGWVHRWQRAQVLATDPNTLVKIDRDPRPALADLSDWYQRGFIKLLAAIAEVGPDHLTPTWSGPRPAKFWVRRAAHETAVHRWDAEGSTASGPQPLDPHQAVDLLDELFEVIAGPKFDSQAWDGLPATIHLHATDQPNGEWLIRLGADGFEVTKTHAKGDVAVKGPVSDLALMMVGRMPPARLEIFGEASVIDRWFRTFKY